MKVGAIKRMLILFIWMFWMGVLALTPGCRGKHSSDAEMVALLKAIQDSEKVIRNPWYISGKIALYDSVLRNPANDQYRLRAMDLKADALLKQGRAQEAADLWESVLQSTMLSPNRRQIKKMMAISYMRIGEATNCLMNHTGESCVFPIRGTGIHINKAGSHRAIELYEELLQEDSTDLESRWLLNIACMTIGGISRQGAPQRGC